MPQDLKSLTLDELTRELTALAQPPYRSRQLYQWMHQRLAVSYDAMPNIPNSLKALLQENFTYTSLHQELMQESRIDGTRKYLFSLADDNCIESVWLKYRHGNSVCVSSQVGCRMGCRFCASTLDGLNRNLLAGEMLDQIYAITRQTGERVSNVVIMGSGEPLDNYDNVVRFIRMLSDEHGLHISQRNITLSTCGLAPEIRRLAGEKLQITLALSLHAPTDEKRRRLMPVAYRYSLEEVLDACEYYFEKTGRRLTFEYSLVRGVNDNKKEAMELIRLLKSHGCQGCHVNLIPVNPIEERDYQGTEPLKVKAFQNLLDQNGINATIRREMGRDIDGACGQLRRRQLRENAEMSATATKSADR
ncbi:MAG: 23S rRNA (adenine(2503)-C(2))-methyltransferase RlmN [Lachnospiraceae bacterium]|nr:23S rRNA (adenine(2503)-C(2))-methyltransferase RlmN [Lachnospiraceae bacterium]